MAQGLFRDDLLARIQLWTFRLPGLRERVADIEPNLEYELELFAQRGGHRVTFNKEARTRFLDFAVSADGLWRANFRDLNSAVVRLATLADGGRVTRDGVEEEIARLQEMWCEPRAAGDAAGGASSSDEPDAALVGLLGAERLAALDLFDRMQLAAVIAVCRECRTLSAAGRKLFAASRAARVSANDADRLRKYLARFGLSWSQVAPDPV